MLWSENGVQTPKQVSDTCSSLGKFSVASRTSVRILNTPFCNWCPGRPYPFFQYVSSTTPISTHFGALPCGFLDLSGFFHVYPYVGSPSNPSDTPPWWYGP